MKNLILVAVLATALSACSTVKLDEQPVSNETVKMTQDFGKVEVTFTDKGDWELLKSSATATLPINDDAGLEQAMNVATMRAKRNIVEFIQLDLQSSKTTEAITNSLAKEIASDDQKSKERAANIATKITEKITIEANGILNGTYITERKVSNDRRTVVVTVQVDKRSIRAAKQIRSSFGQ